VHRRRHAWRRATRRALHRHDAGGGRPLGLIHIDAHADTGDDYGGSRFHHGAPFKIATDEGLIDPKRTIQVGIRGSLAFEDVWSFSHRSGMRVMGVDEAIELGAVPRLPPHPQPAPRPTRRLSSTRTLRPGWPCSASSALPLPCSLTAAHRRFAVRQGGVLDEIYRVVGGGPAYLSFDIDALDPAYAPGTGTPEVGGLSTHFAQQLLRGLGDATAAQPGGISLDLVGCDLVEVSPPFDTANLTSLAAANLLFEMLCVQVQAEVRRRGAAEGEGGGSGA